MKDKLDKVKRMLNLLREIVILADKLNENEKEFLLAYVNYDNSKIRFENIIKKFA